MISFAMVDIRLLEGNISIVPRALICLYFSGSEDKHRLFFSQYIKGLLYEVS